MYRSMQSLAISIGHIAGCTVASELTRVSEIAWADLSESGSVGAVDHAAGLGVCHAAVDC